MTLCYKTEWPKNLLAAFFLIFTFIVYNATKAPTLSFWDCGEFIACSYTLGIPHPPGTPLYILIGRIFSIIPFHTDIAANVNMLSVMTGAIAAMFAFLVTFRLIRMWWPASEFNGWRKAATYIGAIVGTSMFAFGRTHWNNSLEAEVYTPAMMILIIMIWLLLRWFDVRQKPRSDAYLLLITFLGFLSIGIHMTTFLFLPAMFLVVILASPRFRKDYRFYITGVVLYSISYSLDYFLWGTGIWLAVVLVGFFVKPHAMWKFSLAMIVLAVIGFSCQLYTPIRSSQKPDINQNDPSSSYAAFNSFLERKQYGEVNMITRAFTRRGEWSNQFGTHHRLGFWGFFYEQYGVNYRKFAFLFVLGLLGLFELARRRPKIGIAFFLMVILGTVFLVWYMNFADGTHQDPLTGQGHTEVRDRDYFFTPGFILFGIAIGLGVAGLMEMARESIIGRRKMVRNVGMGVLSLLVLLAAAPLKANYFDSPGVCDRSRNYTPYDFAYNMLVSCEPNAIMFNGGDNDTFPVWCLQEVYGIRPDVTAINLALASTHWYIKQIRDYMKVPIRWNDTQIDALRHRVTQDGRLIRISEFVVDEIFNVNKWKRPIDFSLTMTSDFRKYRGRSLDQNLMLRGMIFSLVPGERPGPQDIEATHDLYWNAMKFRSLNDSTIYLDPRSAALTGNYTTGLLMIADSLRRAGELNRAIEFGEKAMEIVPFEYDTYTYMVQYYLEAGREDKIRHMLEVVPEDRKAEMYYAWALAYRSMKNNEQAKRILLETLDKYPHFSDAFRELAYVLYEEKNLDQLYTVINSWLADNPGDSNALNMKKELDKYLSPNYQPPDMDS